MEKKKKFYVVWEGFSPGIYSTWDECKKEIQGFPQAKYKSFESLEEAQRAYSNGHKDYIRSGKTQSIKELMSQSIVGFSNTSPITEAIAVDAACSGNPGKMEYRGVYIKNGQQIFHVGPLEKGTNNIGEFLAIVHGLALLKQKGSSLPIYSDSVNAISWIRQKKCKTKLEASEVNAPIFDLIQRAEKWLRENSFSNPIYKWDTAHWGEIPADFGRK
jgi:ribonuclease HI